LLKVRQLDDAALVVDFGRDETDTADDCMFSESFRQKFDVAHAVEHRIDHRFRPNCRCEIVHRRIERIRFDA
jgi:hypothetical protein